MDGGESGVAAIYYFARFAVGMSEIEAIHSSVQEIRLAWDIKCRSYAGAIQNYIGIGGE